jgi:hypothetical protein
MKRKICFIIISALIFLPLTGLAADIESSFNVNAILNELLSGEQTTAPNAIVKKFDLSWSTDTYIPLSYIGRVLPVRGCKIFVDASVSISNGDAKNLKYSWFLDDIFQQSKSGYGKNSFYFYAQQRPGEYHVVRLQVFNEDRSIFQEKTIEIPITSPEVVLIRPNIKKLSIIARPYFFSIDKLTDLVFEWNLSGQKSIISSNYNASVLDINILNKNDNKLIEQELWINVKNLKDATQNAYNSIKINLQ